MGFRENLEKNVKRTIKKVAKILTRPLRRFLIIGIVIAIIIISLGASYDALLEEFSNNVSKHMSNTKIEYDKTNGSIEISDDTIKDMTKLMSDMGVDIEKLKLTEEDLRKIYIAEVVTTEINRGVTEEEGKYYGRVFVKRAGESVEDLKDMTYINTLEELENKVQEYKNSDSASDEKVEELLTYYTVDENDQICFIGNISSQTDEEGNVTKNVTIEKQAYKDKISQFTVPVEFLLNICAISQNPGFTMALAEKILKETKITLAILQTTSNKEKTITHKYKEESISSTKYVDYDATGKYINERIETDPTPTISDEKEEISNETSTSTSSQLKPVSVNTWFMNLTYTYTKNSTTTNNIIPEDDPSNIIENEERDNNFTYEFSDKVDNDDGSYTNVYEATNTRRIDQTKRIDITEAIETYQEGPTPISEDKTDDIVGMLKSGYSVPGTFNKVAPLENLKNGSGIFFNMLANGERTQVYEELMRYILGKATGNDYGITEFDFSIFDVKDFTKINNGASQLLKEYIHMWESGKKAATNADGTKYIIIDDGKGHATVGYGVDIKNSGYESVFIDANYPTEIGGEVPVEFVDSIEEEIMAGTKKSIESYTSELDLTVYQINALVSRAYNCGVGSPTSSEHPGAIGIRNGLNFVEAYKKYWNKEKDDMFEQKNSNANFNHQLYTSYMSRPTTSNGEYMKGLENRRKSEWTLFQTGYYDVIDKWSIGKDDFGVDTIEAEGYIFPHYLQKDYQGSYGTSTIPYGGCGPTSLAMILAGLKGDPSINPNSVVDNIKEYWPDGSYYVNGEGSSHCIFQSSFLEKYYGLSSKSVMNNSQALEALENGYPVIGGEDGHILAIIPAPEEYKNQGYKFYILDSGRGHSGPYKSVEDANKVVRGNLRFIKIIEP